MSRRQFLRILGGGVVVAATGTGLGACSTAYPDEAVAAWRGPPAQADLRRWALAHALLAPSSHNLQSWSVDLSEPNAITLYVDRDRLLPQTDPWFRQIVVTQGCFLEILRMALIERGVDPAITLFPQGAFGARTVDDRPVARVHWREGETAPPRDPLFAQVLRRHTAKVDYDTARPIDPAHLRALEQAHTGFRGLATPVRLGTVVDDTRRAALRALCWEAARIELTTEATLMESVRLTRVGPAEIAQHRDGISLNGRMPRLASALGMMDRDTPPAADSAVMKQMFQRFKGHSETAMGFLWLSTPTAGLAPSGRTRHAEVDAGRAYVRLQLAATAVGLQVHPMMQANQEYAPMQAHYRRLHALLVDRAPEQETVQMFCRIGHCADQPHAPRRDVASLVRPAART